MIMRRKVHYGGGVKILAKEKARVLAEANRWSLRFSEGYLDGETHRRRGKRPSAVEMIGRDEYCLGFRTGYFRPKARDEERPGAAVAKTALFA